MATSLVFSRGNNPLGYGLMGLTSKKDQPFEKSFEAMRQALAMGATNWNAGEFYGPPDRNSLHLLHDYFTKYPEDADKVVLCVKGGMVPGAMKLDGSEENVRRSVDECIKVLAGTKKIDIFEMARVDAERGNETALRVLAEYVKAGKIGGIGLSEVGSKTIRAAHKQVGDMIASVEIELSLWTPDVLQNGIIATCAEFGTPVFAYSPLARGALSDNPVRRNADLPEGDFRKHSPKYQDDVLEVNNRITDAVSVIAKRRGVTVPQVAIAWVAGQSQRKRKVFVDEKGTEEKEVTMPIIMPIPGASSPERVEENLSSMKVKLTEEELVELDKLIEQFPPQGDRYPAQIAHLNNG